jgi:hypothetical protein
VFLAVGELALYIAYLDGWPARQRIWPWVTALIGLAVSVAGNIGHIQAEPGQPVILADAVNRIAAEDREAVRAAAAAADHRLYVPAFTRTNAAVVRRRYRAACPSRMDDILASYDDAIAASTRATCKLDDLALAPDASTWPLAALRPQPQRVLRGIQPRGASAPEAPTNSPSRHRRVAARLRV